MKFEKKNCTKIVQMPPLARKQNQKKKTRETCALSSWIDWIYSSFIGFERWEINWRYYSKMYDKILIENVINFTPSYLCAQTAQ